MANRGPNTNGCQFYFTLRGAPWLNGKHTIFGKILEGQGVIHKIEKSKTDSDDVPVYPTIIEDCVEIPVDSPYTISDNPYE